LTLQKLLGDEIPWQPAFENLVSLETLILGEDMWDDDEQPPALVHLVFRHCSKLTELSIVSRDDTLSWAWLDSEQDLKPLTQLRKCTLIGPDVAVSLKGTCWRQFFGAIPNVTDLTLQGCAFAGTAVEEITFQSLHLTRLTIGFNIFNSATDTAAFTHVPSIQQIRRLLSYLPDCRFHLQFPARDSECFLKCSEEWNCDHAEWTMFQSMCPLRVSITVKDQ
jgi:hypothetical protein